MIGPGQFPGVSTDPEDPEARSFGFGGMIRRMLQAVAIPRSVEEVSNLVRRAARDQVPVTVRGGRHSQGGQSLTDGRLILDTVRLNRVQDLGPDIAE